MAILIPELICETIYDIPLNYFLDKNIRLLILDIDNTLVTYDDECPSQENLDWFKKLKDNGIEISFVSNNHADRVEKYIKNLGDIMFVASAAKPFCHAHRRIMKEKGLKPNQCICIGDQIFTDVLAGHMAGIKAILVFPIKDLQDNFCKFKRYLERPIIKYYHKRQKRKYSLK